MHREYHPDDLRHRQAHAFDHAPESGAHDHGHEHRSLFLFTGLLGVLIVLDLLAGRFATPAWQAPLGLRWIWIAALLGAGRMVYGALEALFAGRIGADFALAQACLAALVLREPFVAAEVVFIALVGEVLEAVTADRAMRAIGRLFEGTPRSARVRRDGEEVERPLSEVVVGDIVIVGPGERVPVDGPILSGRSSVDQSALTGESIPVDKGPGDPVFTGTINQFGRIECQAERVGRDSTLGQVLKLVAEAQRRKAPLERAADRYARWFLPIVETVAGLTLLVGYLRGWPDVWQRTVAILVVACPCALVLATPAAVLASMAWLARRGIVIKGGIALERLAACDTFAFDKTGTLTRGRPELASVVPLAGFDPDRLLRLAAGAEHTSRHPLATTVLTAARERGLDALEALSVEALPGAGVVATVREPGAGDRQVLVGTRRLLQERGVAFDVEAERALETLDESGQTPLIVAVDGVACGLLGLRDTVRPEAHDVIHDLKHARISEVALLTGDRASAARAVAKRVHIKAVESELLPADKARWIADRQAAGRRVAMVGDGINDAPALAGADVGIAIGGPGSDLAAEAGDIVILGDPLRHLPNLLALSRATVRVIRQNILVFAFGLNATAMSAAALGWLGPIPAALLHQVGSLLVLLNAMRLLVFDWRATWAGRGLADLSHRIRRFDDRLDLEAVLPTLWARRRTLGSLVALGAVLGYAGSGLTVIGPDVIGLRQRLGRFDRILGPGLHLGWPAPIDHVTRLAPERLRSVTLGFRGESAGGAGTLDWETTHERQLEASAEDEALVLTGDGRLVELTAVAQYSIDRTPTGLRQFAFGVDRPEQALRPLLEAAVRRTLATMTYESLLTADRRLAERAVATQLQRRLAEQPLGLVVRSVAFQEVHPPLTVVDAYRDVSRAQAERTAQGHRGQAYRFEQLGIARSRVAQAGAQAESDRFAAVSRAGAEGAGFAARAEARSGAEALTDRRLGWDAVQAALSDRPKLILDVEAGGPRRHLILSDPLLRPPPAAAAGLLRGNP